MKALILSCNTGGGHNTAAAAILEELQARGIESEVRDTLVFGSAKVSRVVSGSYVHMTTAIPSLFGCLYKAGEFVSGKTGVNHHSPVYFANTRYAARLSAYIDENSIDTVICPHLFPAEALTYLRQKYNDARVHTYGVATDYCLSPFWEETYMDGYFVPHPDILELYVKRGVPRKKLWATGIPVSRKFREKLPREEARKRLGLPEQGRLYLIMTGSMGYGNTLALCSQLLTADVSAGVLVLTGNNHRLQEQLSAEFGEDKRVIGVPFTHQVNLYMDACDVLLTKPGGLSSTEAAVKGVPFIHTMPIPGCETLNAAFFSARGLSLSAADIEQAVISARALAEDEARRQAMVDAQHRQINAFAARDICDQIIAHNRILEMKE